MLKIRSRIAVLYSLLTIFFIVMCVVLFYVIFNAYDNIKPVMQSMPTDISKEYIKSIYSNSKITKNYIYMTSKDGTLEKSKVYEYVNNKRGLIVGDANVGYGGLNEGDIVDVYKTQKGNRQYKYTQNYLITEFDEKNNVINSGIIPDELLQENLKEYNITNSKMYFKNKISLKDFLSKHNSGKIEVITDNYDNVIGSKILKRYGTNYNDGKLENNLEEFESEILHILYKRAVYIAAILILMVIIINFILSKKYAVFALKPLIEFTGKVKEQSEFKGIKLIEMPEVKDEIYDLTFAYNEAMGKVKKSYENLQRLNSYASHELRNSLAVLRGKIEMGEDTKEINAYIDKLTGVTNDILAMSTSKLCNSNEKVDLALICAKVVDDYLEIFKNIELNLPEDGVNLIKGKEMWIERCVINLIDNAIKFADKNKQDNKIVVEVWEDDSKAVIEVWDNGIGVEKNKMEEIFKPYYGTNSRVSTGIGLAYVKHVMELHGGKVTVQSKKGEYSKFLLAFYK